MCYEKVHTCKFCKNNYPCDLPGWACPTINGDEDELMCDNCKKELEDRLQKEEMEQSDE